LKRKSGETVKLPHSINAKSKKLEEFNNQKVGIGLTDCRRSHLRSQNKPRRVASLQFRDVKHNRKSKEQGACEFS
jgi:hypothetical protein